MITVSTFTSVINSLLPEPHAGLLSGILFGTQMSLSPDLKEALIATGTLHIIALSGTNITILTQIILWFLLLFCSRRIAAVLSVASIVGFVLFVGPSPSVVRAAIMGALTLVAWVTGRRAWGLASWGIAVAAMLLFSPLLIANLSFQLSALASLGMVLFSSRTESQGTRDKSQGTRGVVQTEKTKGTLHLLVPCTLSLLTFLRSEIRTTLSAQVFTIPVIFWTFHRVSLISPLSNLLIGWMIPQIMIAGFLTVLAGIVWFPIGSIVSVGTWAMLEYVVFTIQILAKIPGASVDL